MHLNRQQALSYLSHGSSPVGEHLGDQKLLPVLCAAWLQDILEDTDSELYNQIEILFDSNINQTLTNIMWHPMMLEIEYSLDAVLKDDLLIDVL